MSTRPPPAARLVLAALSASAWCEEWRGHPDGCRLLRARIHALVVNPGGRHDDFNYGSEAVEERRTRFDSRHCFSSLQPGFVGPEAFKHAETQAPGLAEDQAWGRVALSLGCVAGARQHLVRFLRIAP